jgi:hypothetical protein
MLSDELLIALVAVAKKLLEYVTGKAVQASESWRIVESLIAVVAVANKPFLASVVGEFCWVKCAWYCL